MEKYLSFPDPKITSLRHSWYLRTQMHKINGDKAQMLIDAVHSTGAAAEMPSVVPGEGPCGTPLPASQGGGGGCRRGGSGVVLPLQWLWILENKHWTLFSFFTFFRKKENPLWIYFGEQKQLLMQVFHKAKWLNTNFWEVGDAYTSFTFNFAPEIDQSLMSLRLYFMKNIFHERWWYSS